MKLIEATFLFRGRITRGTFLWRIALLGVVCAAFGTLGGQVAGEWGTAVFSAVFLWGALAAAAQRLHDIRRSGWALLMLIIPVFGPVWVVIQLLRKGASGRNRYGDDPAANADYLHVDIGR